MNPAPLPSDLQEALALYQLLNGLTFLLGLVNSILVIVLFFRRPISLDKELSRFVLKSDCAHDMEQHDAKRRDIYATFNARFQDGEREFKELQRAIGRIEGSTSETRARVEGLGVQINDFISSQAQ